MRTSARFSSVSCRRQGHRPFPAVIAAIAAAWVVGVATNSAAQTCDNLVGVYSSSLSGTTSGASQAAGTCGGGEAPERSITFTAPRAGAYTFDTLGSLFDTVLYVRSQNGQEIGCNDDIEVGVNSLSRVTVTLGAGQLVHVFVDGFGPQSGNYTLRIDADCPLPFRTDPRDLEGVLLGTVSGTTTCATNLLSGSNCGDGGGSTPDAAFVYTAPVAGSYEFSTEGSNFDTIITVRLGTCGGEEMACNDDVVPGSNQQSRVTVMLNAGQTVIVGVDGFGVKTGNYVLSVSGQPNTPTITPSRTVTRTATVSPTITPTPSITQTPSQTATRTATRTPTGTSTATATRTRTATPTPTRTATPSSTPSTTSTRTPSRTATVTSTPTASFSPSLTATPSRTLSPTRTFTPTVTFSPSPTPSATPTPSVTRTGTETPTRTRTGTPSFTPSFSPTRRPTSTATGTPTGTGTFTGTPTLTPSSTRTSTPTATATFNGLGCCQRLLSEPACDAPVTLTVCEALNGIFVPGGTCSNGSCLGGSPVPTATSTGTATPTPTITGTPTSTPTPSAPGCCQRTQPEQQCSAPVLFASCLATGGIFVEGGGCVGTTCVANPPTATITPTRSPSPTFTSTSTLTASPTLSPTPSTTPSTTPTVTLTATATASFTVTATASPTLTATTVPTVTRPPTATATATVAAVAVNLSPSSGIASSAINVQGQVAAGNDGVRVLWDDGENLIGLADGTADAEGRFHLTVVVPADALAGTTAICVVATNPGVDGRDQGCADFTVLATPPGSVLGRVLTSSSAPVVGADVRLVDATGVPVATAAADGQGRYALTGIVPGTYELVGRCPLASTCAALDTFFPTRSVVVSPAAMPSIDLVGTAPPQAGVVISVGGVALPGGLLSATAPVRVVNQFADVGAQLGSLSGLGVAPLNVRFWADVEFFTAPGSAVGVRFEILQSGVVLASRTATTTQPIVSGDPTFGFTAYAADFNVNDLPAGDLTLRITPLVVGASVDARSLTLRLTDLAGRWFTPYVSHAQLSVSAVSATAIEYAFSGQLPQPPFTFEDVFVFRPGPFSLGNEYGLQIPVSESFRSDGEWSGRAVATASSAFLGGPSRSTVTALNGPLGPELGTAIYDPLLAVVDGRPDCLPIPATIVHADFTLAPCPTCASFDAGASLNAQLCRADLVQFSGHLSDDFALSASLQAGVTAQAPVEIETNYVLCSGQAVAAPQDSSSVALTYGTGSPAVRYTTEPSVSLEVSAPQQVYCGGAFVQQLEASGGFSNSATTGLPQASALPVFARPQPAVAANGDGLGMAVWVGDGPAVSPLPDRRVLFSSSQGKDWSAPLPLTRQAALVEAPQVVFLDAGHALAVWVENRLPPATGLGAAAPTLLANTELMFAIWDGQAWGAPQPITNDDRADVMPSLAADPDGTTAVLVWLRTHATTSAGNSGFGVYSASFDGTAWSAPEALGTPSAARDRMPVVAMDRLGRPAAVWVREVDGDPATAADRQLVWVQRELGGWSAPVTLSGFPAGAYSPSLAFDNANNPLIAFVVPATDPGSGALGSGDGNDSLLAVARRVGQTWTVDQFIPEVRAERPLLRVDSGNRATILFRGFDESPSHRTGDLAAAARDLNDPTSPWGVAYLTQDGAAHTQAAFAVDPNAGTLFIADVTRTSATLAPAVEQLIVAALPDLALLADRVHLSNSHPLIGDTVSTELFITNRGVGGDVSGSFTVSVYDGDLPAAHTTVTLPIDFGQAIGVPISFTAQRGGQRNLAIVIDEAQQVRESDEANNTVLIPIGQVPAPTALSSSVDQDAPRLRLQWQAPATSGLAQYLVYRAGDGGSEELIGAAAESSFVDTLAQESIAYSYRVTAVDVYGVESGASAVLSTRISIPVVCTGDCNSDGEVTIDELLLGVNIALETQPVSRCTALDANHDGAVTVDELLIAVNHALGSCS